MLASVCAILLEQCEQRAVVVIVARCPMKNSRIYDGHWAEII